MSVTVGVRAFRANLRAYLERASTAHFRATAPARGHWRLVVDEAGYRAAVAPG